MRKVLLSPKTQPGDLSRGDPRLDSRLCAATHSKGRRTFPCALESPPPTFCNAAQLKGEIFPSLEHAAVSDRSFAPWLPMPNT